MEAWLDKIGLLLISLSWLFQAIAMLKSKTTKINIFFVLCYLLGLAILIYDQYMMGLKELSALNLLGLIFGFVVLFLAVRKT